MKIVQEKPADMRFLYLQGRLDESNAQALEDSLDKLIADGARQLIVDCSQVELINNAGLRTLINIAKHILTLDGRLAIHSPSEPVKEIFEKTGFYMVSRVYDTREEAIAGVAASGLLSSSSRQQLNKKP